jgi:hypothetical protein
MFEISDAPPQFLIEVNLLDRFIVVRRGTDGTFEPCQNWEELEPDARTYLEKQVGGVLPSAHYPCPQELLMRARWAGSPVGVS